MGTVTSLPKYCLVLRRVIAVTVHRGARWECVAQKGAFLVLEPQVCHGKIVSNRQTQHPRGGKP